ncbi:High affinity transport system protein p37 precursor [Metamycoplasma cloacale]|uniref:Alkylphosphonate ABC transporter substrate-binidng protein n=1 Tax=Metamycoplasma cloacale TaxID=92401 RepID=A0A2Z4LMB4_9BACT
MKFFKLFSIISPMVSITPLTIACNDTKEHKVLNFAVIQPWYGDNDISFFNKIEEEYNKLKTDDMQDIKFNISFNAENIDLLASIRKGSADLAIVTSALYDDLPEIEKQTIKPFMQTQTTAFKFDKEGMTDKEIINTTESLFNAKPFVEWNDSEYQWDGNKYNFFYDNEGLSDFYRGAIWIWGNPETLGKLKEAWDNKDYDQFINYGIQTGKESSASKYLEQEKLFVKHFNKTGNEFKSFAFDKIRRSDKYKVGNAKELSEGPNMNYHIVFDELGSFAYTHNYKKLNDGSIQKRDYFRPKIANTELKLLAVTDKIYYNKFVLNTKKMNDKEIKLLQDCIINVKQAGYDNYGPRVGFNGYKRI